MNMNKMIEQMEKSYMGGVTEPKEEPKAQSTTKATIVVPPAEKNSNKNTPVVATPTAPPKGKAPNVPGVPLPPPLNIPLPPKIV